MGFDWAHTISSISKLILRSARNSVDGGSRDNSSKDCRFESICNEYSKAVDKQMFYMLYYTLLS